MRPDDICPRPDRLPPLGATPHATPIYPTSVWRCEGTDQAEALLTGDLPGFVYQRDGHPNGALVAGKLAELHGAERAVVTSSGMAALAAAVLSQLRAGDHVVVSDQLYGRSLLLLRQELPRWGIQHTLVDPLDLGCVERALTQQTRMVVVETIANPLLRCVDLAGLAALTRRASATLLVDNTFATPVLCRPLELGADLVMESVSKMINGHSDVMLGALCGRAALWERVPQVVSTWGLASSPWDSWLTERGLATLALRMDRACDNALSAARHLASHPQVERVDYPGLPTHPDHHVAVRQFGGRFGSVVTFRVRGGREGADRFLQGAAAIPFCPSLGEVSTTVSHPESTSHRGLTAEERQRLGIGGGTLRLSVGVESREQVVAALDQGLAAVK